MPINYYDRTMRPALLVEGSGKASDALFDLVQSMHAITHIMRALLVQGEDQCFLAEPVYRLLDQQCAMLHGVYEELGAEQDERDAKDEAKGIVSQSKIPTEALTDRAHKLRVQFIESNTNAGVDPGLIGAALNLTGADVGRVIARLRGEAAPAAPAAAKAAGRRAEAR